MNDQFLKNTLATSSSISTIIQFLTGILVCQKIVKNKSTGDLSPLPFISGCLSTALWLAYGFFIRDTSLILVNTVGTALFFAYVLTYLTFSIRKVVLVRQFLGCLVFFGVILYYIQHLTDYDIARRDLGIVCCIVTLFFFAAPLASLMHVLRVKNTDSLPYPLILMTFIVSVQWFFYGVVLNDYFIQIPNFIGCLLTGFQLSLFRKYPSRGVQFTELTNVL